MCIRCLRCIFLQEEFLEAEDKISLPAWSSWMGLTANAKAAVGTALRAEVLSEVTQELQDNVDNLICTSRVLSHALTLILHKVY